MSSIDVLKRELDSLNKNISHWLGNGADESSNLIKHRLEQKKALDDAVKALEKVDAIRDRVSLLNKKAQKHGDLSFESLLEFIDSLDKE